MVAKEERREERREDRRDRVVRRAREDIVAAALRVIARKDLAVVRVEEIAQEAGYAPGSLYTYFSGKEELLAEAVRTLNDRLLERLEGTGVEGKFEDALRALIRQMFDFASEHRGVFNTLLVAGPHWMTKLCGERVNADIEQCRARYLGQFARFMEVGVARGALASARTPAQHTLAFMGIAHSFLVDWLLRGTDDGLVEEADVVVAAFLDGARRRDDDGGDPGEKE